MNPVHGIAGVTGAGHARRKGKHQVWPSTLHMFVDEMQLHVKFTIKDMDIAKVCATSLTKNENRPYNTRQDHTRLTDQTETGQTKNHTDQNRPDQRWRAKCKFKQHSRIIKKKQ